jgi:hypothetical protein
MRRREFITLLGGAAGRKSLIELSHIWMEAALKEERHVLHERASDTETCSLELDRHDSHQCFHPRMICGSS